MDNIQILAAPIQGYTDAAYRKYHHEIFGGVDLYHTPFCRIERGEMRRRDVRDFCSPLNAGVPLSVQVIFNGTEELKRLIDECAERGVSRIDLNAGCPFVLQLRQGRGAALLKRPDILEAAAAVLRSYPDISFSLKLRPGMDSADEWKEIVSIIDDMPLQYITMHARTGKSGYDGELEINAMEEFCSRTRHPVVYNGGIMSVEDFNDIIARFPSIKGIMAGRGLLCRPSLAAEIASAETMNEQQLIHKTKRLHDRIYAHYREVLCGETQILSKIKPFWDYAGQLLDKKARKSLHKAGTLKSYERALSLI